MSELWNSDFRAAVTSAVGTGGQAYAMVNRRVEHAFSVWRRRYQMNPAQEDYGWQLLTWAVNRVVKKKLSGFQPDRAYIYWRTAVCREMEFVVHSPVAHEGFKRRAELVNVRDVLREALA